MRDFNIVEKLFLDNFNVLKAVCSLSKDIIKLVNATFKDTSYHIRNDEPYYPYFKDCVGVIGGTHVKIYSPY